MEKGVEEKMWGNDHYTIMEAGYFFEAKSSRVQTGWEGRQNVAFLKAECRSLSSFFGSTLKTAGSPTTTLIQMGYSGLTSLKKLYKQFV
jgi:hypothetical protein